MKKSLVLFLTALFLSAPAALAVEPGDCSMCHDTDDLKSASAEALLAALKDANLRAHSQFADVTEAEVQQLVEALKAE